MKRIVLILLVLSLVAAGLSTATAKTEEAVRVPASSSEYSNCGPLPTGPGSGYVGPPPVKISDLTGCTK